MDALRASTVTLEELAARPRANVRTVGQFVHDVLREAIMAGVYAPGEHMRQDDLADRLGVSRIPVRSALMQLESEGLVHFHPHRGAVVRKLTENRVREVYEIREILEVRALRKSVATLTPERAGPLLEHARILDAAHEGGGLLEERVHFYNLLYDADANPLLVELIEHLRRSVGPALLGLRVGDHDMSHVELAEAVAAGDADAAIALLVPHLREVCEALVLLVRDQAGD